jgi:uridine kinase
MVVSISGAAGIGKSTFSAAIANRLRERHGIDSVCVLPLDSFMLDRANRIKSGLSGYHPRANDLAAAERGIQALISGNHISVRPYSHVTGSHMEEFKISGGQRVYILDGIHSMHPQLINFVSLSIFLWAEDDELKELRFISDVLDRCYVIRDAFNHADAEFNEYQKHVAKYSKVADMNLRIFGYWKMQEN